MWLVSLRDLQWRKRRFATAIAGTSLVFAMTLVLSGLTASFGNEATRTLDAVGADAWVVREAVPGPFTSLSIVTLDTVAQVEEAAGVEAADPIVVLHQAIPLERTYDVNVLGVVDGGIGTPPVVEGRGAEQRGEAVVDESLGLGIGESFTMGEKDFEVVGLVEGITYYAGQPVVFVALNEARDLVFEGQPVATAVVTRGMPEEVPEGLKAMSVAEARADLLRPLDNAVSAINLVRILLWIVAASIVGSVIYISTLERLRDFAVLKATGASNADLMLSLAIQSVVLSLTSALLAALLAQVIAPAFPLPVAIPISAVVLLPVIAVVVGLIASLSGLRRAISVDPALAFGGP